MKEMLMNSLEEHHTRVVLYETEVARGTGTERGIVAIGWREWNGWTEERENVREVETEWKERETETENDDITERGDKNDVCKSSFS